jgi:protein ImuB
VWLIDPPEALRDGLHGPQWQGDTLQLLSGPERLETGWWDSGFVERDYFIAQARDGMLLWIYRPRRPDIEEHHPTPGWFLQGRFG